MINYNLKLESYQAVITPDKSHILNIARKVTLLKAVGSNLEVVGSFSALGLPSCAAISSNFEMVAYKNRLGRIALHNTETGELIAKHSTIFGASYELFFLQENKKIISSNCGDEVYCLDITSGELSKARIGSGEYNYASIIPGLSEDEFLLHCTQMAEHSNAKPSSTIFKLMVNENRIDYKQICDLPYCNPSIPSKFQDRYIFVSLTDKKLYTFDLRSNTLIEYADFQQLYLYIKHLGYDGYTGISWIDVTKDDKYLILVFGFETLLIVDRLSMKCVKKIDHHCINTAFFFNDDKSLWVDACIYSFDALLTETATSYVVSSTQEYAELPKAKDISNPNLTDLGLERAANDWVECRIKNWATLDTDLFLLPKPCQHVYTCSYVTDEVVTYGFINFFFAYTSPEFANFTLTLAEMAVEGFSAMGLPALSEIMKKAISLYHNNRHILDVYNDGTRKGVSAASDERIFVELEDDFEEEFAPLDIAGYIRANIECFSDDQPE